MAVKSHFSFYVTGLLCSIYSMRVAFQREWYELAGCRDGENTLLSFCHGDTPEGHRDDVSHRAFEEYFLRVSVA